MTNDDIADIERETGRKLPQSYVDILQNYPPSLVDPNDKWEQSTPYMELYRDKPKLIAHNPKGEPDLENWRHTFFVIGDNGCGEFFVIDTAKPHAPVYVYSNHIGEFEPDEDDDANDCEWDGSPFPHASTIADYVKSLGG